VRNKQTTKRVACVATGRIEGKIENFNDVILSTVLFSFSELLISVTNKKLFYIKPDNVHKI